MPGSTLARTPLRLGLITLAASWLIAGTPHASAADHIRDLQAKAIADKSALWGYWGPYPNKYTGHGSHSNRLIPVYTFGIGLESVKGEKSCYRDADRIEELYGQVPEGTLNPDADYFDQTDVFRIQEQAIAAGKKRIILLIFDGMDWQTSWAAAIHSADKVGYRDGRGTGLSFQDYDKVETDFGYFVSSPHNDGTEYDVDAQTVISPGGMTAGGYDPYRGGSTPWSPTVDGEYLIGKSLERPDAVTDSSSSATSMTAGIKTFNEGLNVDFAGNRVETIAHKLQRKGFAVGAVTSVPFIHATPAAAYVHNVGRDDYQDLARDILGLPSISHRDAPLDGMDVVIGTGWGVEAEVDKDQGQNFVPGNSYISADDLAKIDQANGGRYRVVQRASGVDGGEALAEGAAAAAKDGQRLFGFFGVAETGHLPFQTADGGYDPPPGRANEPETYTPSDVRENPTLAEMTNAALSVLERDRDGFWLMVEAGDVDWANHDNNLDNSIGAVLSGDEAFRAITVWVEAHDAWKDTAVIVTADHGHYLVLATPEALLEKRAE